MQYLTTITAALLATTTAHAAALPNLHKRSFAGNFDITGLYMAGTPHSVIADYSMSVTDGVTSANCSTTTYTSPSISVFPATCCKSSTGAACDWTWEFLVAPQTAPETGYVLRVNNTLGDGSYDLGGLFLPSSDIVTRPGITPTGDVQVLNASSVQTVPFFKY